MNGTLDATERELTAHGPRHDWKSIHGQAVILGFLLVATQRMAIHLGHGMLQVPTVILAATVVWFLARLKRRPDLSGALWYAGLVLCAAFSALLGAGSGLASMVLPFALFIVTYSPVLVAGSPTGIGRAYLEGAMGAVRLGSILGVFQYIWQASGRGFFDPMKYLPEWLSAEGFNSYYPLAWGSTQYKPNGVIFLEPS
ncbi:MAG: hypothetical protein LBJ02_01780, partial [Bifidobacteriaceae bacterium]|nr:hypothetical protein [Bifidobacteriaceae bacterium]